MKDRGVSAVVATVLIIMITVAAVGLLWALVVPMIKEKVSSSDECGLADISIDASSGYTCYEPNNITLVRITKGEGAVNISSVKISLLSGGNSVSYVFPIALSNGISKVFYLNSSNIAKVEKISVFPFASLVGSTKTKMCSEVVAEGIPVCVTGEVVGELLNVTNESCVVNCGCASAIDPSKTCSDGCGGVCVGTKRGSVAYPFLIYDWNDLHEVRENMAAYYVLMNDLDSSTASYSTYGNNWQPIGSESTPFSGNFNGQNKTISNLVINLPYTSNVGLFGYVTGSISNLGLLNINVVGGDQGKTGGLVGWNSGGTIVNSYSAGSVLGLSQVGGLVGKNSGAITNSYSTATVNSLGGEVGGLVGEGGTISNSYSTGNVNGLGDYIGGLIGNGGTISNSYSTGNVTGSDFVGGFVGYHGGGTITNSYSTGNVTGSNNVGGFAGLDWGTSINSFWDTQTSGQATSAGGAGVRGKTTAEMKNAGTYIEYRWEFADPMGQGIWGWNSARNNRYPYLTWQKF